MSSIYLNRSGDSMFGPLSTTELSTTELNLTRTNGRLRQTTDTDVFVEINSDGVQGSGLRLKTRDASGNTQTYRLYRSYWDNQGKAIYNCDNIVGRCACVLKPYQEGLNSYYTPVFQSGMYFSLSANLSTRVAKRMGTGLISVAIDSLKSGIGANINLNSLCVTARGRASATSQADVLVVNEYGERTLINAGSDNLIPSDNENTIIRLYFTIQKVNTTTLIDFTNPEGYIEISITGINQDTVLPTRS